MKDLIERLSSAGADGDAIYCWNLCSEAADAIKRLTAENERLQNIIDSRPAINAALPESYIDWSQKIYVCDTASGGEFQ